MSVKTRVQVLLRPEERERFRRQARAEGLSLSGWLRRAGLERLDRETGRMGSVQQLATFFERCDEREAGCGPEPEWEQHLEVMRGSRRPGESGT